MGTGKEKIKNYKGKRGGKVMKKKGFTLIELVVVVAIILLLAATLAPKLRKEVSKAKDAKAVALLGAVRSATSVFFADNGTIPTLISSTATAEDGLIEIDRTSEYVENSVTGFLDSNGALAAGAIDAEIPAGAVAASSTTVASTEYGLDVTLDGNTDGDYDFDEDGKYDTRGNAWASY
ncbi:prepilin-type N-terminal cleavage/methylation domain-containing protein [uncultured Ilyobacter sp.]|uniref:type II secretion system protein n=1 Tax=uncultured Ilyobacter sp. TaxID=544433 RepID=UPI0029F4E6B0|nr:prepilin-type N-terminal cleavage/methylation domain-containing protein [uncultured Ilyobacter sp.]